MRCSSCIQKIEGKVKKQRGVIDYRVNFANKLATIIVDDEGPSEESIATLIRGLGYPASIDKQKDENDPS